MINVRQGKKPASKAATALRGGVCLLVLIALWKLAVVIFQPAHFILPPPERVFSVMVANFGFLLTNAAITLNEMILGFLVGSLGGMVIAILLARFRLAEQYMMPLVVTTQTLPVFAIAPLLVIWFGLGIGSKIVMSALIIFFPVTSTFYDGLKSTPREWQELAESWGATAFGKFLHVEFPAALPNLASGLKIAATIAPIGAIVGEWAGASGGLGYVMLQSNARMQTDLVFASLFILALAAFFMRYLVGWCVDRLVFWGDRI